MLDLEKAKQDLKDKSYSQIQSETAWVWASRSAVSYENVSGAEGTQRLVFWTVAEELYHEAVEHAALSGDDALLKSIRDAVQPYQEKAAGVMSPETPKEEINV